MKWEILGKAKRGEIEKVLLKNRKITNKREFFSPTDPQKVTLSQIGVNKSQITKAIARIKKAKKKKEKVIIYGDYDADGICATAILWEALFAFGVDVLPHIPDRFEEGYGINEESVKLLKEKIPGLSLIVTIDNGIVASKGVSKAKKLGIDVVVIDHHQKGKGKLEAVSVIHTTQVCGSALAYFFAKQLGDESGLDLAVIGTISDQMPLVGVNRSIVKFGLPVLENTGRIGLLELFREAGVSKVGTYEIGFIIAPRINAAGRLAQGIDSLRLLCTKDRSKALGLAQSLGQMNQDRQRVVEEVVIHTKDQVGDQKVIVIAHESYHEGVIGLAAGKLVEEFYRPAIVLSKKGEISKASARSISGFNIIEHIRKLQHLILEGGGHPMAAGFSIETAKIPEFAKAINEIAQEVLTDEILTSKLKIDMEINFDEIDWELVNLVKKFDPTGLGNPAPTFATMEVEVAEVRPVGQGGRHLKLKLRQEKMVFDSIYFGGGDRFTQITPGAKINVAYQIEENVWNNTSSLQLKIKDVVSI